MSEPTQTPRYWGESFDEWIGKQSGVAGVLAQEASSRASKDQREGLSGFWEKILGLLNNLIFHLMKMVFPNSTEAEQGLNNSISQADIYAQLETNLELEGIGRFMREASVTAVRGFNGGLMGLMPTNDGIVAKAQESALTLHNKIVTQVTNGLIEKHKDRYTDEQIGTIAQNTAATISGLNPKDVLSANSAQRIATSTPTTGLVALLTDTARAATQKDTRGQYKAANVGELTVNNDALTAMKQALAGHASPQPASEHEQQALVAAVRGHIQQLNGKIINDDNFKRLDTDSNGSIHITEAIAALQRKGITATDTDPIASLDQFTTELGLKLKATPNRGAGA